MDGNKVNWSVACDQMTGAGEFVYSADTYTGTMRVKSQGKEMTMKYAGKRLGDCTKKAELPRESSCRVWTASEECEYRAVGSWESYWLVGLLAGHLLRNRQPIRPAQSNPHQPRFP